jgi:hypothetical protein
MASGLSDHVWTLEEVVELLDRIPIQENPGS